MSIDSEGGAQIVEQGRIEIQASLAPKITFATHQNDVPLIADLVIANPSEDTLEDRVPNSPS